MPDPSNNVLAASERVALVITCFNDGRFIGEAVDSGRVQGVGEAIVVDDGSSDPDTHRVLDRLEKEGVRVIRQENSGVSAARMVGVRAARKPYVQSLDSDDLLGPGALGQMAAMLDADPDLDAVWGDVETFGEREYLEVTGDGFDPWRITFLNEIPATIMIRRSTLLESGGWDVTGYEDWDLWMTATERGWRGTRFEGIALRYRVQATARRLDMLYEADRRNHEELRRRHASLYRGRRASRRTSRSRPAIKIVWPLVDALPFVSGVQKNQMIRFSRDLFEPRMRADRRSLRGRVVAKLRRRAGRVAPAT